MSSHPPETAANPAARKPITLHRLRELHAAGENSPCSPATTPALRVADDAGVELLLVGDSLGMVLQGRSSTLPVTLEDMAYHVRCVAAGNRTAFVIGDLPFGGYQQSRERRWRVPPR